MVQPARQQLGMVPPGPAGTAIDGSSQSGPAAPGKQASVSLTMIVKNEEGNLPHCLESVRDIFEEIIIVDTGSSDRTIDVARSFGAKVFEFVWIDSFAAAHNEALAHATGDYAFWLDADDVVDPHEREKLKAMLRLLRVEEPAAYVVRCACDPSPDGTGGETVVDHIRLFPLRDDVRWTYRVGSVTEVVSTTAVLDQIIYDPFGNLVTETNATNGDRFKFAGMEYDAVTGLYYDHARYYDAGIGRFTSQDPMGFDAGDPNIYRYAHNSPTDDVDPSGEQVGSPNLGQVPHPQGPPGTPASGSGKQTGTMPPWKVPINNGRPPGEPITGKPG